MRAKRNLTPHVVARLRSLRRRYGYSDESERVHAAYLTRTQPATVTLRFPADHIAALGQARDELERKA